MAPRAGTPIFHRSFICLFISTIEMLHHPSWICSFSLFLPLIQLYFFICFYFLSFPPPSSFSLFFSFSYIFVAPLSLHSFTRTFWMLLHSSLCPCIRCLPQFTCKLSPLSPSPRFTSLLPRPLIAFRKLPDSVRCNPLSESSQSVLKWSLFFFQARHWTLIKEKKLWTAWIVNMCEVRWGDSTCVFVYGHYPFPYYTFPCSVVIK